MARDNPVFRLAFRKEGEFVNCYLADPGTMEGAQLLASISHRLCESAPGTFDNFKRLMTKSFNSLTSQFADIERWDETPAPEHERAGHS